MLNNLNLGEFQCYDGLVIHNKKALEESNINYIQTTNHPSIFIFSRKYFHEINELKHNKNMILFYWINEF